jgi:hypothetical protein
MAPEPAHRSERRPAGNAHLIGLLQQPFPQQNVVVSVVFAHIKAQKVALIHSGSPLPMVARLPID